MIFDSNNENLTLGQKLKQIRLQNKCEQLKQWQEFISENSEKRIHKQLTVSLGLISKWENDKAIPSEDFINFYNAVSYNALFDPRASNNYFTQNNQQLLPPYGNQGFIDRSIRPALLPAPPPTILPPQEQLPIAFNTIRKLHIPSSNQIIKNDPKGYLVVDNGLSPRICLGDFIDVYRQPEDIEIYPNYTPLAFATYLPPDTSSFLPPDFPLEELATIQPVVVRLFSRLKTFTGEENGIYTYTLHNHPMDYWSFYSLHDPYSPLLGPVSRVLFNKYNFPT